MNELLSPKKIADIAANLLRMHLIYDIGKDGVPMQKNPLTVPVTGSVLLYNSDVPVFSTQDYVQFNAQTVADFLSPSMEVLAASIRSNQKGGFVFASMNLPANLEWAEIGESGPVAIRLLRGYDIREHRMYTKVDCLVVDLS